MQDLNTGRGIDGYKVDDTISATHKYQWILSANIISNYKPHPLIKWRPPVKKGRKAHFKICDKTSRHFMREENFRLSISTQVGQYGRYYCTELIRAKYFRARFGAIFFAKYKCVLLPFFTGALQLHSALPRAITFLLRRDKLNSQFIVIKISILHAGGRSFFTFQTSREYWKAMLEPRNRWGPAH